MKIFTKAAVSLSIFFIIAACNFLTPSSTLPSSSIWDVVTPTQISDEEAIRVTLADHLGVNANDLAVMIDQNTGSHARGSVENGYVLVVKVNNQWQIVADSQTMLDCQLAVQYGFPPSMVPECPAANIIDEIHFEPGGTYTVVENAIGAGERHTYLLYASAGQTMDVQLSSPHLESLSLGVYGKEDGQPYQRYQVKNNGFYGVLPLTQGYYLKVFSNGTSTDFSMKITFV